ncbi:MAG: fluoride efflux transporter CrcB [Caldilineaceae bacterium]|nr:fluoride efflux transporter CrcB [Caldilineaceae bacterium]
MPNLATFTWVFIGGALGSWLRWWLGSAISKRTTGRFPLGTCVINVTGAFVMGLLSTLMNVDWRDRYGSFFTALVLTGLLGGYTTFSSYELDSVTLYNKKAHAIALLYWAGSVAAGLVAAALGWWIAMQIG